MTAHQRNIFVSVGQIKWLETAKIIRILICDISNCSKVRRQFQGHSPK